MFQTLMNIISLWTLPAIIVLILTMGLIKKVPLYETFTEGAKDGFKVSVTIIPYLVAIIVAISMFRASGIIEQIGLVCAPLLAKFNIPADTIPIMLVRSLSGSGASTTEQRDSTSELQLTPSIAAKLIPWDKSLCSGGGRTCRWYHP